MRYVKKKIKVYWRTSAEVPGIHFFEKDKMSLKQNALLVATELLFL